MLLWQKQLDCFRHTNKNNTGQKAYNRNVNLNKKWCQVATLTGSPGDQSKRFHYSLSVNVYVYKMSFCLLGLAAVKFKHINSVVH